MGKLPESESSWETSSTSFDLMKSRGGPRRRGSGEGHGGIPADVAGVAQGTAEEESRGGRRGGDNHEDQEEEPGRIGLELS
jgi:hypothetical protein